MFQPIVDWELDSALFFKILVWGPFRDVPTVKTARNGLQGPYHPRGGGGPGVGFKGALKETLKFSQRHFGGQNLNLSGNLGETRSIPFLKYCSWAFQ